EHADHRADRRGALADPADRLAVRPALRPAAVHRRGLLVRLPELHQHRDDHRHHPDHRHPAAVRLLRRHRDHRQPRRDRHGAGHRRPRPGPELSGGRRDRPNLEPQESAEARREAPARPAIPSEGTSPMVANAGESVFPRLEELLPRVRKPVQYVGGELNSVTKDWDAAEVRWALMYPDAYEVGVPNQGIQILYEILNERDGVLAERTYAVGTDLEALMREHGVPQFTVDAHRPVGGFDLLGVSFASEMGYTNLLTALDLAGIPLHAADRGEEHPVVLAGGHAAFNPEPIAGFLDAAVLGDGEEIALAVTEVVREWKREGRPGGRDGLLERLAAGGGVYVPRFYDVHYLPDGRIGGYRPNRPGVP